MFPNIQEEFDLEEELARPSVTRTSLAARAPRRINTVPLFVIDRFPLNQSALRASQIPLVRRVARQVASIWRSGNPVHTIRLVGHADHTGRARYNRQLRLRRATAVMEALRRA